MKKIINLTGWTIIIGLPVALIALVVFFGNGIVGTDFLIK